MENLLFIDWQPSLTLFELGGFAVRWYSFMWVIGLLGAYMIVHKLYLKQGIPDEKFEPLFLYCFLGIIIGARLGHCIFYEPGYYLSSGEHILEMLLPCSHDASGWYFTGYQGLASHGGTLGIVLAIWLYSRKHSVKLATVWDNVAIASPFTACCIRLGNLMNSEIIGNPTSQPWGFIFHTREAMVDGVLTPRHPAQLYEAIAYIIIFVIGLIIYNKTKNGKKLVGTYFYIGYCISTIFLFRFFVEFLKKEQVAFEQDMALDMGQLLSIPFVLLAGYAMWHGIKSVPKTK